MSVETKKNIQEAILAFSSGNLTKNALSLFARLGYNTDRQSSLPKPTYAEFKAAYAERTTRFNEEKALVKEWKYVDLLFQLSKDEVTQQHSLFDTKRVDKTIIETYLFFTIELSGDTYSRTAFSQITREVNKLFPMPVMILFRTDTTLTLSVINRRLHKRDESKDVLEKVTLIKDISIETPHRGHVEILFDLSFDELLARFNFANFVELHNAWQKTLDTKELNKRFYQELSNWYFWAKDKVQFPADVEKDDDKRNSISLIRLITRIIFIWFIKEKNLVPDVLFGFRKLSSILKEFNRTAKSSNFYSAILQNLFFGTLNQKMEERGFAKNGTIEENRNEYGVKNMFRYADQFSISEKEATALFKDIPFLNGGLFDCLDKPDDSGRILYSDGFSRNPKKRAIVPDFLFFGQEQECDLNEIFGTRNKRYKVKGLFEILSSYKFTITENTPIEEEVALDPELFGKVFENLLASYNPETQTTARKQTGSFNTPREKVNYMVDESLVAYFKSALLGKASVYNELGRAQTSIFGNENKAGQLSLTVKLSGSSWQGKEEELEANLRQLLSYSEDKHLFNNFDVDILITAIDACKILDPACGSGAYPMGILHKLVLVLHKLDPHNEKWEKRQIQKAKQIDDSTIRDKTIADIEEAFKNNDLDYGRKLYLIENCIYGVDIQPIAVQITKLRFFISLIIDQKKRPEKDNLGIRSLPNLETKFVAANTLIGIHLQAVLRNVEIDDLEAELKNIRHDYFSAKTRKDKLACQNKDKELRTQIASLLESSGWDHETALQVAQFDPYDQNQNAGFFDLEWMFGFLAGGGFDIVIGNPPYVQIQNFSGMREQKEWERQKFETYVKTGDVYCLFYERGYRFLKNGGVLTYITSNKWMRANYGKAMRKFFLANGNILKLIDFGDSPIFENATTYTNILVWKKTTDKIRTKAWDLSKAYSDDITLDDLLDQQGECEPLFSEDSFVVVKGDQSAIKRRIEKVGVPLRDWGISINYGIKTGLNEAFIIDGKKKDELIAKDPKSAEILKPILRGRDIKRYKAEFADLWLIFIPWHFPLHEDPSISGNSLKAEKAFQESYPAIYGHLLEHKVALTNRNKEETGIRYEWYALQRCAASYYHEFEKDKIFIPAMVDSASYSFENKEFLGNDKTSIITGNGLKYLCALMNSKLLWNYITQISSTKAGGFFEIKPMYISQLPIPKISIQAQLPFEILVDCILFCKSRGNADLDSQSILLESVIDGLVYDLYFPEEMKQAHCYITDRISEVLKPFKKNDTVAFRTEYIKTLAQFTNKDETISHSLVHRHLVKPVQIILGDNK